MTVHFVKGRYVNSYIIEENDKLCVVDVAMRGGEAFVLDYIERVLQRKPKDVSLVICTHDDPDHIGGVHALANICQAQVAIPFASQSLLLKNINNPLGMLIGPLTILVETFRPRMWSMYFNPFRSGPNDSMPSHADTQTHQENSNSVNPGGANPNEDKYDLRPTENSFLLYPRMLIPGFESWQVLHTPGHSWDSICLFHKTSRALLTGDTLLCSKKKNQVVMPAIYTNPFQMKRSIKKLKKLNPSSIHPAHGTVLVGEGLLNFL